MERYESDDEDWHIREVYARFGVAAYLAQVIETSVVNYLVVLRGERHKRRKPFDIDDVFEKLFRQTLGTNAGSIPDVLGETSPLDEVLAEAVRERNELTHHYWRRRIFKMGTEAGRDELLKELETLAARFVEIDAEIREHNRALMRKYGLTDEIVEGLLEEMEAVSRGEKPEPPEWTAY